MSGKPPINVCAGGGQELLHALGDVLQVLEAGQRAGSQVLLSRLRERVSLCRSGCAGCRRPSGAVLDVKA